MIDKDAFKSAWRKLSVRFGREVNAEQANMYFAYLAPLMDTDEFLRSCHAVWATAKWFPRPADFVTVGAAGEWLAVLKCAERYAPPDGAWFELWKALSPRSQNAVKRLGGIDQMKELAGKNAPKAREAFLSAYEEEATAEALALPAPSTPTLKPAA